MKSSAFYQILALTIAFTSCGSGGSTALEASRKNEVRQTNYDTAPSSTGQTNHVERSLEKGNLGSAKESASQYSDGLFLEVTNHLIHYKPELSVAVCSAQPSSRKDNEYRDDSLCFISDKLIKYGETANFYLPQGDLERVLTKSAGRSGRSISIQFNDTHSNSYIHWHCWEHIETELTKSGLNHLSVTATQINMASYSCHVESN